MALASGLIRENCPNKNIVRGTSPTVTAYCVRVAVRKDDPSFCLQLVAASSSSLAAANKIAPTAPKESQNPGDNTAQGSSTTTSPSARHNTEEKLVTRPFQTASATTHSMYKVRCAGTPNPANATYRNAMTAPASAATFCAGTNNGNDKLRKNECRQRKEVSPANKPAIIVMCNPEMLMRCPIPARLNTVQSDCEISRWSPITSATITPA